MLFLQLGRPHSPQCCNELCRGAGTCGLCGVRQSEVHSEMCVAAHGEVFCGAASKQRSTGTHHRQGQEATGVQQPRHSTAEPRDSARFTTAQLGGKHVAAEPGAAERIAAECATVERVARTNGAAMHVAATHDAATHGAAKHRVAEHGAAKPMAAIAKARAGLQATRPTQTQPGTTWPSAARRSMALPGTLRLSTVCLISLRLAQPRLSKGDRSLAR